MAVDLRVRVKHGELNALRATDFCLPGGDAVPGEVEEARRLTFFMADAPILALPCRRGEVEWQVKSGVEKVAFRVELLSLLLGNDIPVRLRLSGAVRLHDGQPQAFRWRVRLADGLKDVRLPSPATFYLDDITSANLGQVTWTAPFAFFPTFLTNGLGIAEATDLDNRRLALDFVDTGDGHRLREWREIRATTLRWGETKIRVRSETASGESTKLTAIHRGIDPSGYPEHRLRLIGSPDETRGGVGAAWNAEVERRLLGGLRVLKEGHELSVVPHFLRMPEVDWEFTWPVREDPATRQILAEPRFDNPPSLVPRPGRAGRPALRPAAVGEAGLLRLHGFADHDAAPAEMGFRIRPPDAEGGAPQAGVAFALDLAAPGPTRRVRIGALDLELGGAWGDGDRRSSRVFADLVAWGGETAGRDRRPEVALELYLPVMRVEPGGQDDGPDGPAPFVEGARELDSSTVEGDDIEPSAPLLVPLPAASTEAVDDARYRLRAREATDGADRRVTLRLERMGLDGEGGGTVLVLDEAPFLVARVEVPPLVRPFDDEPEVANWSGTGTDGIGWELAQGEHLTLALPPQAIGEAMERRKDIGKGELVDYRLGPPAQLRLRPSIAHQRFSEAPWNLRRLLGFAGQRAPGAAIIELQVELLYGLGTLVDGERTPWPLRLAELAARRGALPPRLPRRPPWPVTRAQCEAYEEQALAWAADLRRYRHRLAVLEPWAEGRRGNGEGGQLRLDEGVGFALREAHLTYPIAEPREPLPAGVPAFGDGLKGGVAWGFESDNVYRAVWRDPRSSSGEVAGLALSALGGWGRLRARFDQDRSTVIADVAMGRTSFYSLERIGRIGCLWNRAKHVVVYERTVLRSRQFRYSQNPLEGRAVVRKVREYVEILEKVRRYPDRVGSASAAGCVRHSRFGDEEDSSPARIPVDGSWGRDIGTSGWVIPLWRRDADPKIYPRPLVCFGLAVDPATGADHDECSLLDPEKLLFYTDTREKTGPDPDAWPPIPDIDWCDASEGAPNLPALDPTNPDGLLPDAPSLLGGTERFTYTLATSGRPALVNAGRGQLPVTAELRNVTLQRSLPRVSAAGDPLEDLLSLAEDVADIADGFERSVQDLLKVLPRSGAAGLPPGLRTRLKMKLDAVEQRIEEIKSRALGLDIDIADGLCGAVARTAYEVRGRVEGRLDGFATEVREELETAVRGADAKLDQLAALAHGVVENRVFALRRALGILAGPLGEAAKLLDDATARVVALGERVDAEKARLAGVARELAAEVDGVGDELRSRRADLRRSVVALRERTRRLLDDTCAGLDAVDEAVALPAGQLLAGLLRVDPEAGAKALRKLLAAVRSEVETRFAEVEGALATAEASLLDVEDDLTGLAGLLRDGATALSTLDIKEAVVDPLVDGIATIRAGFVGEALSTLRKIDDKVRAAGSEVVTWINEHAGSADAFLDEIQTAARHAIRERLDNIRALLDKLIRKDGAGFAGLVPAQCERLAASLEREFEAVVTALREGFTELNLGDHVADARRALAGFVQRARRELAGAVAALGREISAAAQGALHQLPSPAFRLVRAWGEAPHVPGLDFNRLRIAYHFPHDRLEIDLTPLTSFVNLPGDELKAIGLRVPSRRLLDGIVPDGLDQLDLGITLPDLGGIRFDGMFPGIKLPSVANDLVKISHGVDPQARRAWVQADLDAPLSGEREVFSVGPLAVRVGEAHLVGRVRAEGRLTGGSGSPGVSVRREEWGRLRADWSMHFGGLAIVVFRDTTVEYRHGRVRFDLSPEKVEMPGALRFLTDLTMSLGEPGSGLTTRLLDGPGGLPGGVETTLDLPLPDVAGGAFALSDLNLGAALRLELQPGKSGLDFSLGTRFHLGTRERPFSLTIAFLAGGGWVDTSALYRPSTGLVRTDVSVGLLAGASMTFRLGPVKGGVRFFFGVEAELHSSGGRPRLEIAILLILEGGVRVFGFISVELRLELAARYESDSRALVGTGRISIKVKIGFFERKFSASVRYRLAKLGGGAEARLAADPGDDPYLRAATNYVRLLAG